MIDREQMRNELIQSVALNKWTPSLTNMMIELANGVSTHYIFRGVEDRDDMVQHGLEHLLKIWHKFDTTHSSNNPFGYFTQSLFREYGKYYGKAIKYNQRFISTDNGDYGDSY